MTEHQPVEPEDRQPEPAEADDIQQADWAGPTATPTESGQTDWVGPGEAN